MVKALVCREKDFVAIGLACGERLGGICHLLGPEDVATCENHLHTIDSAHQIEEGHIKSNTTIGYGSLIMLRELASICGQDR